MWKFKLKNVWYQSLSKAKVLLIHAVYLSKLPSNELKFVYLKNTCTGVFEEKPFLKKTT